MRALLLSAAAAIALVGPARADQRFEATLAGHAVLPAFTMALPPADAPRVTGHRPGRNAQRSARRPG